MKLVTVSEMVEIEQKADKSGHTYAMMMEHAGVGLAEVLQGLTHRLPDTSALGLVGPGNNGGDTLVALAHLAQEYGWRVSAYIVKDRPKDDPLVASLLEVGGEVFHFSEDKGKWLQTALGDHAVLLDGMLGTGVRLPLRGAFKKILVSTRQGLAELEIPPLIIAVDCPTGVDCESGEADPECLKVDITVTMAAVKMGLLRFPAYDLIGELIVVGIGLPDELEPWKGIQRRVVDASWVHEILPVRSRAAHKGTFGTVMVVGGSVNYTGAVLLAGKAAYRAGAGLVTLAVPTPLYGTLAGLIPEATWLLLPHEVGVIAEKAVAVVIENLKRVTALAVGPGFGLEDTSREFLALLIGSVPRTSRAGIGFVTSSPRSAEEDQVNLPPFVVDADGLKLLARIENWAEHLPGPAVLTPHPGEMAILTDMEIEAIQADRLGVAERFAKVWGHVVVLKGACSVIASPDGRSAVVPVATPALARAGTGDVLTGVIAGLLAQGVEPFPAAVAGTWIHAQAGVVAEEILGNPASVVASDVLDAVVDVISDL